MRKSRMQGSGRTVGLSQHAQAKHARPGGQKPSCQFPGQRGTRSGRRRHGIAALDETDAAARFVADVALSSLQVDWDGRHRRITYATWQLHDERERLRMNAWESCNSH